MLISRCLGLDKLTSDCHVVESDGVVVAIIRLNVFQAGGEALHLDFLRREGKTGFTAYDLVSSRNFNLTWAKITWSHSSESYLDPVGNGVVIGLDVLRI